MICKLLMFNMKKVLIIIILTILVSFIIINTLVGLGLVGMKYIEKEQKAIEKAKQSIVFIKYEVDYFDLEGIEKKAIITGSGVIFYQTENETQILTNRHVIDCQFGLIADCKNKKSENIIIITQNEEIIKPQNVLIAPKNIDLALLLIPKKINKIETALREDSGIIGEKVIAIGYPLFSEKINEFRITQGVITGKKNLINLDGKNIEVIESDVYITHGNSGGGLFDSEGNLIGINTWSEENKEIGYSISIKYIQKIIIDASFSKDKSDKFSYCNKGYFINQNYECEQFFQSPN